MKKPPKQVTKPTVIYDLPDHAYHGHKGSLSASGAKLLAPPAPCPAKFAWFRDNPKTSDAFDFGHVAHRIVLGKGAEFQVLRTEDGKPFLNYNTNAAKAARNEAREAGLVPILEHEFHRAEKVAAAIKADPIVGPLLGAGDAEVSLFWPDPETGIPRRARFDWLTPKVDGRRRIIVDVKTARSSEPTSFGKAAADYGYHISAAQYVDGAIACGLDDDPVFLLAVVEKDEPFVVTTFQVTDDDLELGRALMRNAIHTFAACTERNHWPGYVEDVAPLQLPTYYLNRIEDAS